MKKYFSNSTRSFYWAEDKPLFDDQGTWPADAVEISESDWVNFQGAAPFGQLPSVNEDGVMQWENDPGIDTAALILSNNNALRNAKLDVAARMAFPLQSAVALGVATDSQLVELTALQRYAVELLEMNDLDVQKPGWPQLEFA
jgi:hypothetical protein